MGYMHARSKPPFFERQKSDLYIPERYRSFFEYIDGEWVNTAYAKPICMAGSDCEIPRLIVAKDLDDLQIGASPRYRMVYYDLEYDEYGYPMTTYGDSYQGLENYCLFFHRETPIYVFDNHSHALFAWIEAREAGVLKEENVLIRFDAHADLEPENRPIPLTRTAVKQAIVEEEITIKNFTEPALRNGLITEMCLSIGARTDLVARARSFRKWSFLEYDVMRTYNDLGRFFDISTTSLDHPEKLVALMQGLRAQGKGVILDIDFDIFERKEAEIFESYLPAFAREADVVTCATSPFYTDQPMRLEMVKTFLQNI